MSGLIISFSRPQVKECLNRLCLLWPKVGILPSPYIGHDLPSRRKTFIVNAGPRLYSGQYLCLSRETPGFGSLTGSITLFAQLLVAHHHPFCMSNSDRCFENGPRVLWKKEQSDSSLTASYGEFINRNNIETCTRQHTHYFPTTTVS